MPKADNAFYTLSLLNVSPFPFPLSLFSLSHLGYWNAYPSSAPFSSVSSFRSNLPSSPTVIFLKEKGLYAIPFYETFKAIFEGKEVEGKEACIKYFLNNDSIPDSILERLSIEHNNFMEVINTSLDENYTFEELINKYKSEYLKNRLYSSATVLYCSNVFSEVFDVISDTEKNTSTEIIEKVGRNEACPCGSGKKFKNCCGKA